MFIQLGFIKDFCNVEFLCFTFVSIGSHANKVFVNKEFVNINNRLNFV